MIGQFSDLAIGFWVLVLGISGSLIFGAFAWWREKREKP